MSARRQLTRALLRLYPRAWRDRYGAEIADLLERRPLAAASVADVTRSALLERVRAAAPSTVLGVGAMLLILAGIVITPAAHHANWTAAVRPSGMTFPAIKVTFFESELFALLLIACGYWTQLRQGRGPAKAAVRMTLIAGVPVTLVGILMAAGAIQALFPVPANVAQTFSPAAWELIIAPFERIPESAIWGAIGGQLCRWRTRASAAASA